MTARGRLIDADTVKLAGVGTVRLAGIDAPELGQPGTDARGRTIDAGRVALDALAEHLAEHQRAGGGVAVEARQGKRDKYGRIVGTVILERGRDREDVCRWLVRAGFAVAEYGPPDYSREERRARRERAGLWAGTWERPRDWRARGKGASAGRKGRRARRRRGPGILGILAQLARLFR